MKVDPEAWPVISRLMDEWLDLRAEQREQWLANLGPEHANILPALRELLSRPEPGFLETLPKLDGAAGDAPSVPQIAEGTLVGPYRLVRELGRGGMGVVWLAVRADGSLTRDVAIKFPLLFMHSPTLSDRFARERDILARLNDARIARLYDAGVTAQGQPYLVLEYVEGEAITSHCNRIGLDVPPKLKLFLEVLRAVQYAHVNLVVHRDLKPSNILITKTAEIRLLDFGIAKLLEEGEAQESEITRFGGRALTPDFASPEQLAGGVITTATDVYSLGILLYELLTGTRPSQPQRDNPQRPSQAAATEKLKAVLRGDLDCIVLKAIQPDSHMRYSTADAFAQDIERYLSGLPVLARSESAWYRTKKFVLRNKLALSAAAIVLIAIGAGSGVALWEARRAAVQAATARAVSDFLQNDLLSQAGATSQSAPGKRADPDIKVRTALDRAAARIGGKFANQPEVEAAVRQTIGTTYIDLGLYSQAQTQMERAVELRRRTLGAESAETLGSMQTLAEIYRRQGKYAQAESILTALVDLQHRLHRDDTNEATAAKHTLASIVSDWRGDYARAERLYSSALESELRTLGENNPGTLATMNNLAALLMREGKYREAEQRYKKLIEIKQRVDGAEHPSTLISMTGLAGLYFNEGKYAQSEELLKGILETKRRVLGAEHPEALAGMNSLGAAYRADGKFAESEQLLTAALDAQRRVLGPENPITLRTMSNLAELYHRQEKLKQAESLFNQVLQAQQRVSGPDGAATAGTQMALAEIKLALRAYPDGEALIRPAIEVYRKGSPDNWRRYYAECLLGAMLEGMGKTSEAGALLTSGYRNLATRRDSIPFEYRSIVDTAAKWAAAIAQPGS